MTSKFAAAIKGGLAFRGITQGALAAKIDVSENTVSSWVSDVRLPDRESMRPLQMFMEWDDAKLRHLLEEWYEHNDTNMKYKIAGPAYVKDKYGNDYVEFLRDLIRIDYSTVNGLNTETEGTAEQWAPIFKEFPQTWRLIVSGGEIVGYWIFVFLKREYFDKFRSGEVKDSDLHPDMIDMAVVPGDYYAYFIMFTIIETHHNTRAYDILLKSFQDTVEDLTDGERFFACMAAHAYTYMGKKLCTAFGMKADGVHYDDDAGEVHRYALEGKDIKTTPLARRSTIGRKYRERFG